MIEIENLMLKLENKTGCCGSLFIGLDRDGKNVHRFVNAVSQERALEVLQAVVNELTPKIENATVDIQEIQTPQTEPNIPVAICTATANPLGQLAHPLSAMQPAGIPKAPPVSRRKRQSKSRQKAKDSGSLKS